MSRAGRRKGKRGEQEVARMLLPLFPDVRTKRAGGESASVDRGRDLLGTPGLCVQVKRMERPNPLQALEEAQAAATADEFPVAFVKRSVHGGNQVEPGVTGSWCVMLLASDFIGLLNLANLTTQQFNKYVREENQVSG